MFFLQFLDIDDVDFMEYHVHVLTSVVKEFLRELPDPLLTFGLYDEFIRASGQLTLPESQRNKSVCPFNPCPAKPVYIRL